MKKHRLILSLALMASVTVFTGCKEEEVEKPIENSERLDDLRSQLRSLQLSVLGYTIPLNDAKNTKASLEKEIENLRKSYDVDYVVVVTDFQGQPISGATVSTIAENGTKQNATSNQDGLAVFTNLRRGDVTGIVSVDGFTTANYTSYINDSDDDYSATTRIPLFPISGTLAAAGQYKINGSIFYNANDNDDTLNTSTNAAGQNPDYPSRKYDQVLKTDNIDVIATLQLSSKPSGVEVNGNGRVNDISYENAMFKAVWNDDNTFTLNLPAISTYSQAFQFLVSFEEFTKDKTLIVNGGSPSKTAKLYTESRIFEYNSISEASEIKGKSFTRKYFYSDSKN